ncbi:hypothetical protein Tco_0173305 [Tanacetum coccineum]
MTDSDERKHVLDYTHVDLHYVEDQRKNLDEIIDLKKVIEKWTYSEVTLDQLLSEQVLGNIVKALGGKGRKKEKISSKEVVFTKADESSSVLAPEITSDSESECDSQEPLPPLPKLIGATPSSTSEMSPAYVIKKKTEKSSSGSKPCSDKKTNSSTEQLLITLIKEPKCSTCGSTDHLSKEHLEHAAVKKTLIKLKAQSHMKPLLKKTPIIPKPFIECKYYGFNEHHSDQCEFSPRCEVCGSMAHEASDCPKKHPNSKRSKIANKQSEPTEKWVHKRN